MHISQLSLKLNSFSLNSIIISVSEFIKESVNKNKTGFSEKVHKKNFFQAIFFFADWKLFCGSVIAGIAARMHTTSSSWGAQRFMECIEHLIQRIPTRSIPSESIVSGIYVSFD